MRKSLAELVKSLGITSCPEWQGVEIRGITEDSRRVRPGYLFVAIQGFVEDGHQYIDAAIANGAKAIIVEHNVASSRPCIEVENTRKALAQLSAAFFDHPTQKLFAVGVTGTKGKTTVCHFIAHLLGLSDSVLISTVANEARNLRAVTTPSSSIIQQIAHRGLISGKRNLILEVSSAALLLHRVDEVDFDAAVFTNLTHDHLDLHQNKEGYLKAKLRLFQSLKPGAIAIVNRDDPVSEHVLSAASGRQLTYAIHHAADLQARSIRYHPRETKFTLYSKGKNVAVTLPLPGEHNVTNALAAAAVGIVNGIPIKELTEALARTPTVAGRYQFFRAKNGATIVIDFAHSPDSLERMLRSLRPFYSRVICVFGCGGESDRIKRPLMGRISGNLADLTILTTDNPKTEDPERILDEIEAGLLPTGGRHKRIADRRKAVCQAIHEAKKGDAVLIAGKGHETYQIIGHEFVPYSDMDVLRNEGLLKMP
jgi:UDP-N-acetylmuramoyl-L-alanyl-D-glutamate--2,6-diaminopimelate ligase